MWDTLQPAKTLNFALVVEEGDRLRHSIITWLRESGWLVHGATRAEQALGILPHIPYQLIILDSELPGRD
jgi:DNA-binding response OmpR family regulator